MKRKSLLIITVLLIILNCIFAGNAIAANVCTVGFSVNNNNPKRGESVAVTVSLNSITEAIATVGFTIDYDSDIFEAPTIETLNNWTQLGQGTTYMLVAPDYVATTKTGNICKLTFQVKADADEGDTIIEFKELAVSKDGNTIINIDGVENKITVKEEETNPADEQKQDEQKQDEQKQDEQKQDEQKQDEQKQDEQKQDEQKQDEQKQDEQKQDEQKQDEQKQDEQKQDEQKQDDSQSENIKKNDTTNEEKNRNNVKNINNSEDKTQSSKVLPKTGKTQAIIVGGVIVLTILAGVFYKLYRKYNGII